MIDKCPLCNANKILAGENIPVAKVVEKYKQSLGIDTSDEFGGLLSFDYNFCSNCNIGYFSPPISGSEHFYEMLQSFNWYYMAEKNEYKFARNFLKPTDGVLEIGCGKGAFAKLINVRNYLGLEFSKEAQRHAAENGIKVLNESIQDHCITNAQTYDVVCSFQVLEHVTDIRTFIKSAIFCLKDSGLLIFSTPSIDSFSAYAPNFILDMPPHHITRWSDASYKYLANIFNLELVELWHEPLQYVHREFYTQTLLTRWVMKLLRQKTSVWNDSIAYRLTSLACCLPSKLLSKFFLGCLFTPRGISVTAVFRKRLRLGYKSEIT